MDIYFKKVNEENKNLINIKETDLNFDDIIEKFQKYSENYAYTTDKNYDKDDINYILTKLSNITNNHIKENNNNNKNKETDIIDVNDDDIFDVNEDEDIIEEEEFSEVEEKKELKENINNDKNKHCLTNDIWVSTKANCGNEYIYKSKNEIRDEELNKFDDSEIPKRCLIIQDKYEKEDLNIIYRKCPAKDFIEICNIVSSLTNYYQENEKLLSFINDKLLNLKNQRKYLIYNISEQVNDLQKLILNLNQIYYPIKDQGDIKDIFKCDILKYELLNFYNSIIEMKNTININSICFLAIALLIVIGIIFLINAILRNSKEVYENYLRKKNNEIDGGLELIDINDMR